MDMSASVLTLDLTISDENVESDAWKLLRHIRPSWNQDRMKFKIFTDGITNKLIGCYQEGDPNDMILVRVNGEGSDIIIDRDKEQETFQVLGAAQCAPPLYCVFNNGITYGFYPGQPLDENTVRKPKIQRLIAEELVQFHRVSAGKLHGPVKSCYNEKVQNWIDISPSQFEDLSKQQVYESEIPSKAELQTELQEIVQHLDALNMPIVFSHNDLLLKNIIYNKDEEKVKFIDYEYACYNYEAFDIGDHFTEYPGMEEVNYDLYPSREEQLPWLRYYLEFKAKVERKFDAEITDRDVEKLYVETNKCACAAHFMWGVWSLLQAEHSAIDFDYVRYASIRFSEYFRRKKEFFPMAV